MDLIELTDIFMELPTIMICYAILFIIGIASVKKWVNINHFQKSIFLNEDTVVIMGV